MAIIQRPTKQGNTTTYQAKVALGYTKILASEVDADFDLIYSAWNAGVDGSNIKPGTIIGEHLAPLTITNAQLAGNAVTRLNLAPGSTLWSSGGVQDGAGPLGANPVIILDQTVSVDAARPVMVFGTLRLRVVKTSANVYGTTAMIRVLTGGTAVSDGEIILTLDPAYVLPTNQETIVSPMPLLSAYIPPASGTRRFKLIGSYDNVANYAMSSDGATLFVWQWA